MAAETYRSYARSWWRALRASPSTSSTPTPSTRSTARNTRSEHQPNSAPAFTDAPPPFQLFTQNLSLFAKLFLDNKSVFFDVVGFHYYLLTHAAQPAVGGCCAHTHAVGFFSKEKMSWDNNNLACILVFPPWQRRGLGRVLMGASYELGRREGRIGGPEKPLSELGKRGYMRFWQARVAREVLLGVRGKSSLTVKELAGRCAMLVEDVVVALKEMGVCEVRGKGDGVGISKSRVRAWVAGLGVDLTPPVDEDAFLVEWSKDTDED